MGGKRGGARKTRAPDFPIEDAADAYTLYVLILGISEQMFLNATLPFLASVVANKQAYDEWDNAVCESIREEVR